MATRVPLPMLEPPRKRGEPIVMADPITTYIVGELQMPPEQYVPALQQLDEQRSQCLASDADQVGYERYKQYYAVLRSLAKRVPVNERQVNNIALSDIVLIAHLVNSYDS